VSGSVLSDGTIRRLVNQGHIRIDPWDPDMVQPASVDLKLGPSFRVFHNHRLPAIDLAEPPQGVTEHVKVETDQSARPSSPSRCRTTWSRESRARAPWAGSG
jgi:dCTP deaminase